MNLFKKKETLSRSANRSLRMPFNWTSFELQINADTHNYFLCN